MHPRLLQLLTREVVVTTASVYKLHQHHWFAYITHFLALSNVSKSLFKGREGKESPSMKSFLLRHVTPKSCQQTQSKSEKKSWMCTARNVSKISIELEKGRVRQKINPLALKENLWKIFYFQSCWNGTIPIEMLIVSWSVHPVRAIISSHVTCTHLYATSDSGASFAARMLFKLHGLNFG